MNPYYQDTHVTIYHGIVVKDKCFFDRRGIFHACQIDGDKDCIGCKYERVIARSFASFCHWCGETIEADRLRAFCNNDHKRNWLSRRLSWVSLSEDFPFWSDPIFNDAELEECQREMLGCLSPAYIATRNRCQQV